MRIVCLLARIEPVAAADSAVVSARRRTALHIAVIAEDLTSVNALLAMGAALEALMALNILEAIVACCESAP